MLSCGYEGIGRLWPVEKVAARALKLLRLRGRPFERGFAHETPGLANGLKACPSCWQPPPAEPPEQAERIVAMQLHIVLPVKVGVIAVVLYYLFYAGWLSEELTTRWVVQETLQRLFPGLCCCATPWPVSCCCSGDGSRRAFFNGRVFPGPAGRPFCGGVDDPDRRLRQHHLLDVSRLDRVERHQHSAGNAADRAQSPVEHLLPECGNLVCQPARSDLRKSAAGCLPCQQHQPARIHVRHQPDSPDDPGERPALHLHAAGKCQRTGPAAALGAVAADGAAATACRCCWNGSAGRWRRRASSPCAKASCIPPAGWPPSLRIRSRIRWPSSTTPPSRCNARMRKARPISAEQIGIIQEEVERSDRIITQIMGYAQLSEGHVEKLNVIEELERAIAQVFPSARSRRHPDPPRFRRRFPAAVHAAPPFVGDVRQPAAERARSARGKGSNVFVTAHCHRDHSVEVTVRDDGPGIPPDKQEQIFEAYYTTKEKGTGPGAGDGEAQRRTLRRHGAGGI